MPPNSLKDRAVELRQKGKTYTEISKILNESIPKGTLSGWLKDVVLSPTQKNRINRVSLEKLKYARAQALISNKRKQEQLIQNLTNKNTPLKAKLDKDVLKMLLSVLYLGEGSKYVSTRFLNLGNSNSGIISLYLSLLRQCFILDEKKFRVTVQCRADQKQKELEDFWQQITNIPKSQFYKTRVDNRSLGKRTTKKSYFGVCVVSYFDTKIQLEIELLAKSIINWVK